MLALECEALRLFLGPLRSPARASSLATKSSKQARNKLKTGPLQARFGANSGLVQRLSCCQNGIHMPWHFHAAPFLAQHAIFVDQEGAAIHTQVFLAV